MSDSNEMNMWNVRQAIYRQKNVSDLCGTQAETPIQIDKMVFIGK